MIFLEKSLLTVNKQGGKNNVKVYHGHECICVIVTMHVQGLTLKLQVVHLTGHCNPHEHLLASCQSDTPL